MAEISIVNYSDIEEAGRIDAEFFRIQDIINLINKLPSIDLQSISSWITQGPNPKFSEVGIPCLTGRNISTGQLIFNNSDIVSEEEYQNLKRFRLEKNDILITLKGAGSTGKIVLYNSNKKSIFSRNIGLIRLRESERINPHFLFVFLSSNLGQKIIDRGVTGGTGQLTLPTGFLKKLRVPLLSKFFQTEIENMVKNSNEKQNQSKQLYKEAEQILLKELGLLNHKPKHQLTFSTTKKEVENAARFDAEYFQPKYEEIIEHVENYSGGFDFVGNVGKFKNGSFIPDKHYVKYGKRAYIRIKELSFDSSLEKSSMVFIDDNFVEKNETKVNENDFIFATIGNTIGKVNLITCEFEGSFPSNNTSVFSLNNNIYPYFYETLFRSFIFQEQVQRIFTQTAQPKISNTQLEQIKIPLINQQIQKQIANKIQQSHKLRKESKELLEQAKTKVEKEIEKQAQKVNRNKK